MVRSIPSLLPRWSSANVACEASARQQFLVRGKFLQEVESDDEDEDDEPALDTFWVDQADLLSTIAVDDVEEALERLNPWPGTSSHQWGMLVLKPLGLSIGVPNTI